MGGAKGGYAGRREGQGLVDSRGSEATFLSDHSPFTIQHRLTIYDTTPPAKQIIKQVHPSEGTVRLMPWLHL